MNSSFINIRVYVRQDDDMIYATHTNFNFVNKLSLLTEIEYDNLLGYI